MRSIRALTRDIGATLLGSVALGLLCTMMATSQAQSIDHDPLICGDGAVESIFVDYSKDWSAEDDEDRETSLTLSDGSIVSTRQISRDDPKEDTFTRLTRYQPDGTVLSQRDFSDRSPFSALAPLSGGRFVALDESDVLVVTADGAIEHQDPIAGPEYWHSIETIIALSDGSQLLVGYRTHSESSDDSTGFAIKVAGSDGVSWRTDFNADFLLLPTSALELADGSVVIVGNGWTRKNEGLRETAGIARLDLAGEILLLERRGRGIGDNFIDITPAPGGSFIVSGTSRPAVQSGGSTNHFWLTRFREDGTVMWDRTYQSPPATVSTQEGYVKPVGDDQIEVIWFLMSSQMNDLQRQECTYLFDGNGEMIAR